MSSRSARKRHTRRKRRSLKAVLKHGSKAKRRHARPSGRTGRIFSTKLASRNTEKNREKLRLSDLGRLTTRPSSP